MLDTLVGRLVYMWGEKDPVRVVAWSPLSGGMCDTIIVLADGREVAVASSALKAAPGHPPLPTRAQAQEENHRRMVSQLRAITNKRELEFDATFGGKVISRCIRRALKDDK